MTDPILWLQAVMEDPDLTSTQKAVAAALWSFMDQHGTCWPGLAMIGCRAGIRKRDTVRLAITGLVSAGWLVRQIQPTSSRRSNEYRAILR